MGATDRKSDLRSAIYSPGMMLQAKLLWWDTIYKPMENHHFYYGKLMENHHGTI